MKFLAVCLSLLGVFDGNFAEYPELKVVQLPEAQLQLSNPSVFLGASQPISDTQQLTKLTQTLSTHLHKLDGQANGGNLTLLHIHSATSQTVAGISYNLFAELKENKVEVNCTIKLWEQSRLNFVKLDLECDDKKRTYAYESTPSNQKTQKLCEQPKSEASSNRQPETKPAHFGKEILVNSKLN